MMQKNSFSLPHHLSALSATFEISLNANYSGFHAEGCQYHVHGVLVQEGAWQMLPSEVIGYDAAVGVPVTEKIRCTVQLFPS